MRGEVDQSSEFDQWERLSRQIGECTQNHPPARTPRVPPRNGHAPGSINGLPSFLLKGPAVEESPGRARDCHDRESKPVNGRHPADEQELPVFVLDNPLLEDFDIPPWPSTTAPAPTVAIARSKEDADEPRPGRTWDVAVRPRVPTPQPGEQSDVKRVERLDDTAWSNADRRPSGLSLPARPAVNGKPQGIVAPARDRRERSRRRALHRFCTAGSAIAVGLTIGGAVFAVIYILFLAVDTLQAAF